MIVMKFGGMSIADAGLVQRVAEIVRRYLSKNPVVVNSAMGKTTRNLLNTAQLSAGGKLNQAEKSLKEIHRYHLNLINQLSLDQWHESTIKKIEGYFQELIKLLGGISILNELTPRAQDKFLSYGELISTAIVSAALNVKNMKSDLMDARKLVITDENFTGANPITKITYRKIQQALQTKIQAGTIPVVQGFIGSTQRGATTTLGFEGSDLTACLLGAALKADDIQIWKDVSGIMTADPEIVSDARTVKNISFDEVGELTYFGAKVFYSRAVEPARRAKIPVHVFNSKAPDRIGTEVTFEPKPCANLVKSIAYQSSLSLIRIHSNEHVSRDAFRRSVFELADRANVNPKIGHISKDNIVLIVETAGLPDSFLDKLRVLSEVRVKTGKATVTLVGENMRDRQDIAGVVLNILKSQSLDIVSNRISPINFTIVIDEKDVKTVLRKLHRYFFKRLDASVFE